MSIKIVAELSANHNHDIEVAKKTILAAKECGADAIKLQTYTADTLTIDCDKEYFQLTQGTIWDGRTLYDLYKEAYTPWEWHPELFHYAKSIGIEIFSTPFDKGAVDLLESLQTPIYKIASFEIVDIPLISYAASKGKPMVLSMGIASLEEIEDAVETCRAAGNQDITLLQCTSQYPAKPEDANLKTIFDLKERFGTKVGLSDHTLGEEVAGIAASMGISMIEKHFIIDRNMGGPDASFSMEPDDLKKMVERVRRVERILGQVDYTVNEQKEKNRVFARSLFVVKDVKAGEKITEKNVRSIRPGNGLKPKYFVEVLGKLFTKDIERGTPLDWDMIEK